MGWWDRADFVQRRHHGFHDIFRLAFNPADFIVIALRRTGQKFQPLYCVYFDFKTSVYLAPSAYYTLLPLVL